MQGSYSGLCHQLRGRHIFLVSELVAESQKLDYKLTYLSNFNTCYRHLSRSVTFLLLYFNVTVLRYRK